MRPEHVLKKNHVVETPSNIIFVDTETTYYQNTPDTIRHTLRLGVAKYIRLSTDGTILQRKTCVFYEPWEFWDFVEACARDKIRLYITSHNLSFDLPILATFHELPARGYKLTFWTFDPRTQILRFKCDTHSIVFVDNASLFPGKLEKWGRVLGFQKLPMPDENASDDEWITYCERDVDIMIELWLWWIKYLRENNLGSFKYTTASQAFSIYRHKFMRYPIYIHSNEKVIELERKGYKGGRVSAFRVGKFTNGPYYKLDVNSMYPYVMREFEYPTRLIKVYHNIHPKNARILVEKYCVMADVVLKTDEDVYPIKMNNKNVYPIGIFRTVLSTPELTYALEHNHVLAIITIALYRKRPIFREYVEYFYKMKVEAEKRGDYTTRYFAKILLNSLYGKFGQRGINQRMITEFPDGKIPQFLKDKVCSRKNGRWVLIANQLWEIEKEGESYNSFPAIAAHVTAYSRMHLWYLINKAGKDNVLYCDTDSLITNSVGYENVKGLVDNEKLGYLKVEGIADEVIINAPKDYRFGNEVKRKGIPKDAKQLGENTFEVVMWPSLKTQIKVEDYGVYENRIITKTLKRTVDWGTLGENGQVKPYVVYFDKIANYDNK